jgi:Holliday junction resolvasome RuvABC ATP-dependent DNA helicase subunit
MIFLGQHHIMNRLGILMPTLYKNPSMGLGILFAGPSGYGKTTLAISSANYLTKGHPFTTHLGSDKEFHFERHVTLIDEVHLMQVPEILYPILDEKKKVLILTTNFSGNLPEALRNRCREYVFTEYSEDELVLMAMENASFKTTIENYLHLVKATNGNPRELKKLVDDFGMYFNQNPSMNTMEVNFEEILANVYEIENGINTLCRRYLEVLSDVGGKASLNLLKIILHLDVNVITQEIEPVLLKKGLVQISSKGRILV